MRTVQNLHDESQVMVIVYSVVWEPRNHVYSLPALNKNDGDTMYMEYNNFIFLGTDIQ